MSKDIFKSLGAQTFLYPNPLVLVGTYGEINQEQNIIATTEQRKANIMTASSVGICSDQPPTMMLAIRPSRHSHASILKHKAFTINIPDSSMLAEVDYAGIFSGESEDKISQCNFQTEAAEHVDAPYLVNCPVVLELKLLEHHRIGTHSIFFGEIMDTKIKEHLLDEHGIPKPKLLEMICYIPMLKEYWGLGDFKAKAFGLGKTLATKK